ncbi:MAG: nucleotidyltransferase domain-containing protein [Proteobacteria bacterium]|nr:nucleotidyltransferase domain-containing protein [Pseudomonadota bacterium]
MNTATLPNHPLAQAKPVVLAKFRAALDALYGDRIERVVLYGSRARGDARDDSDYDVAVFLQDLDDRWAEVEKIAYATSDILAETGAVIHAMPYRAGSYQERTPLMHEVRREGVEI